MADGSVALNEMARRLRSVAAVPEEAAPEVARELEQILAQNIDRSVGPDGEAWPPTKDGRKALLGAKGALSVRAVGSVVVARLTGHHARHHLGAVRGAVRRRILPTGKLPDPMTEAIRRVIVKRFERAMGGR